MAKLAVMGIGIPGAEISIEYNTSNQRIQQVQWAIPAGVVVRARVYNTNLPLAEQLVIDMTEGQGSGAMNIPGNHRVVQETYNGETDWYLPPYIVVHFQMQTIG